MRRLRLPVVLLAAALLAIAALPAAASGDDDSAPPAAAAADDADHASAPGEDDGAASAEDAQDVEDDENVEDVDGDTPLVYYYSVHCPVCRDVADPWVASLADDHPDLDVRRVDVDTPDGAAALTRLVDTHDHLRAAAVPAFAYGPHAWVGLSDTTADEIAARVAAAHTDPDADAADDPDVDPGAVVDLGPFGEARLDTHPLLGATLLIGAVDGFNPCSLWVLTVLLAMVLPTRSRRRVAAVGATFLTTTAAIYGLFIAGAVSALAVAANLRGVQLAVAAVATGFALVNLKDFVAPGRGVSLSIPDWAKPRIYRGGPDLISL